MPLPADVQSAADAWIRVDPDPTTCAAVEKLVKDDDEETLRSYFLDGRIAFGTAGLRSALGPGYKNMNEVTVGQAAQGLIKYLQSRFEASILAARGVVVGYDGRHKSRRFAEITANACLAAGVKCRLATHVVPTPYVAFGCRLFNAVAGVMVTASHNPKRDNGYKVYWEGGAQIVPPTDAGIAQSIDESLVLDDATTAQRDDYAAVCPCPIAEIEKAYFSSLEEVCARHRDGTAATPLHVTYTAMHGVGGEPVLHAVRVAGFPSSQFHIVEEQQRPDPEFPTVTFPNPEEGRSALELAIKRADATGSAVIVANDPDADRFAVAERHPDTGKWRVLTGNETAALLGWWLLEEAKASGFDLSKGVLLSSTVSSHILKAYAKRYGCTFEETLTGFKWMASRGGHHEDVEGRRIIYAFEESIGHMCGNRVRDKDGVTAIAVALQLVASVYAAGGTLQTKLEQLYSDFGYHMHNNSYVTSSDPKATVAMFNSVPDKDGNYPTAIGGLKVVAVRDLRTGLDTRNADRKATLPISTSPMVTFYLEEGVTLTVRGSGTEPKIKWYCEAVDNDRAAAQSRVDKVAQDAVRSIIQPDRYHFSPRAD